MEGDAHYAENKPEPTPSGGRDQTEIKFGTLQGKVKPVMESLLFAMPDDEADAFIEGRW